MLQAKIVVIGSINMDLVTRASKFPRAGETLLGNSFHRFMGGKGANQAIAAARLGADVCIVGAVGDDDFGYEMTPTSAAKASLPNTSKPSPACPAAWQTLPLPTMKTPLSLSPEPTWG